MLDEAKTYAIDIEDWKQALDPTAAASGREAFPRTLLGRPLRRNPVHLLKLHQPAPVELHEHILLSGNPLNAHIQIPIWNQRLDAPCFAHTLRTTETLGFGDSRCGGRMSAGRSADRCVGQGPTSEGP